MGDVVLLNGSSVTVSQSSIEQLKNAVSDRLELTLGGGDDPLPYGAEARAVWSLPDQITEEMLGAAVMRRDMLLDMLQPAGKDRVMNWLVKLGTVSVVANSGETAADKVNVLVAMMEDEPAGAFTKPSIKRAVKQFNKFFPSGHELLNFVEAETARIKTELYRIGLILDTGIRDVPPKPKWSKEAADAHREKLREQKDRERRELAQALRMQEASAPTPTGTMKPLRLAMPKISRSGEDDPSAA